MNCNTFFNIHLNSLSLTSNCWVDNRRPSFLGATIENHNYFGLQELMLHAV